MTIIFPSPKDHPRFVVLCGRIFRDADPAYFPRVEYRGRTVYLCTDSCRDAFLSDPDVFCKAHRNSETGRFRNGVFLQKTSNHGNKTSTDV